MSVQISSRLWVDLCKYLLAWTAQERAEDPQALELEARIISQVDQKLAAQARREEYAAQHKPLL